MIARRRTQVWAGDVTALAQVVYNNNSGLSRDCMPNGKMRMSAQSKRLLLVGLAVAAVLFVWAVQDILAIFVLAVLFTYLLLPAVERLERLTRLPRGLVVGLIYLVLLALVVGPLAMATPRILRQVQATAVDLQAMSQRAYELAAQRGPLRFGDVEIRAGDVYTQVQGSLQSVVSYLTARTAGLVVGLISGLALTVLILVVSFYLLKDTPRFSQFILSVTPSGYQQEVQRMLAEVHGVFGTFLRGQLLLMLSVFLMTAVVLSALGLRHALPLALVAGLLEIVPIIGPVVAAVPAVAIAVFQEPTPFGLTGATYPLLIVGVYVLIQQTENHLLLPNIIGHSVGLHPAAVIFAVLAGATIGGLLGVFLAAPVAASLRIVGRLVLQLLLDQGPPAAVPVPAAQAAPAPTATSAAPSVPEQVRS